MFQAEWDDSVSKVYQHILSEYCVHVFCSKIMYAVNKSRITSGGIYLLG